MSQLFNLWHNNIETTIGQMNKRERANNPNTPPETLTILARDEDSGVRYCVANNPSSTREVIQTVRAYEFYKELEKEKVQ